MIKRLLIADLGMMVNKNFYSKALRVEQMNYLKSEKSPYLLQHAENPVNWYPWGTAAFDKARAEDKPVFLSVGYSTCHWCHVLKYIQ